MTKVLFLNSDSVCAAFKRSTGAAPWECESAASTADAQSKLSQGAYDAIVADLQTAEEETLAFLRRIAGEHPSLVRVVCSTESDHSAADKVFGIAHQVLPANSANAAEVVERSIKLRQSLTAPELAAAVHRIKGLPSIPKSYAEITELLRREDFHQAQLIRILSRDPALAAGVLKVANSAYYGAYRKISALEQAVTLLGVTTIRNIVFFTEVVSKFSDKALPGFDPQDFWQHSVRVADSTHALSRHFKVSAKLRDEAFTAALLHDIGKLVLFKSMRAEFKQALEVAMAEAVPLHEAESWVIGAGHEEIGGYLLSLWGLPDPVVEAVMYHHHSIASCCKSHNPLSLLRVANEVERRKEAEGDEPFDLEVFEGQLIAVTESGPVWRGLHLALQEQDQGAN